MYICKLSCINMNELIISYDGFRIKLEALWVLYYNRLALAYLQIVEIEILTVMSQVLGKGRQK